ncbi:uncharacterized protein LOC112513050 [Cynara cardunculus var. scolymus]|uniref:Ribosomal protein L34Ae n=1 Tax=Cynara cardunculus var. scolymus TaxID=59895 RepID=A0A103Y4U6_CYNCS|nr:uncharacterized protein LOC112513050 [Cynara cardunculus var. scolymus]KVI02547.1 Protein of unknown function DUF1666 [Cynara cardunculus var. scolymus]
MAVLANCWLIIEVYLIPYGFKKWFYLSFYIHPFFLFFCQILLWIKTLKKWILFVVFFVNRYTFSHVFGVLRRFLIITRSFSGFRDGNNDAEVEDSDEDLWYEVEDSDTGSGILFLRYYEAGGSCEITKIAFCDVRVESVDQETVSACSSSDLDDERSSSCSSSGASSFSLGAHRDMEVISHAPSLSSSSSALPIEDQEAVKPKEEEEEEEEDSFYKSYTERMSWFDLLNQERTCGLNAFLTKKRCSNVEKRLVKSLESDMEMVYVAQSCLSWEALHDQYRKLESMVAADISCTSGDGALITCTLASKFQRFQILLDRFMEDERSENGKRFSNFIHKRSSLKTFLQVPHISENVDNEKDGRNEGLMIRATDVLKAIEKCMKTFQLFIEVDEKQPWWRASGRLSWSRSPLEDPRDSNLLHDLTRTLRQKELWMKDLKGKTRCWLRRRVQHLGDVQNKEMMFAMIELKLVARVLMMSVISTSQLHWCQQKLDNIEISHGRITRSYARSLLFPLS